MKRTFTLLVLAMAISTAFAQTVKIGGTTYNTITEAIVAATDGDVIDITGVHTEPITIDKNITLRGTDPATDIIQAAADQASATSRVIYIDGNNAANDVSIENLTVRYGKADKNGGGIFADKVTTMLNLYNVTVTENVAQKNGGALSTGGSNVNINYCTFSNNTATDESGGALHILPNNGAAIDAVVNVKNSVINNNTATKHGGGLTVNGNTGYGNNYKLTANFENVVIAFNQAGATFSGGAMYSFASPYPKTGSGIRPGNIAVNMMHCTVAHNSGPVNEKLGITFDKHVDVQVGTAFNLYNSVVVTNAAGTGKAINFTKCNALAVENNITGYLQNDPGLGTNNLINKSTVQAGVADALVDEGYKTKLLKIISGKLAENHCTANLGVTVPASDIRNYTRDSSPDAGAYELNGVATNVEGLKALSVSLYPNPANDYFLVRADSQVNTINIYSLGGTLVKSVSNNAQVDVSGLTKGVYLVQISGENGEAIKKLVVK